MVCFCLFLFYITILPQNNSNKPFVSTHWQQKEPLGCAVYSHCRTNDSYNNSVHSCCLLCNYVTKPFDILQRVIKSQRVHISERSLSKKSLVKFLILVKLKMSCIVGKGALIPYFEKTLPPLYWVILPHLKGFSFLNYFLADKLGHSTITFGEIMGTPINRVAWPIHLQKAKSKSYTADHTG